VRRLFTAAAAAADGITSAALRWGEKTGRWRRIERGVYGDGPEPPTPLDRGRARVLATGGAARGNLAGVLHGFDAVELDDRPTRRDALPADRIVQLGGVKCADALTTLVDLASSVDDLVWEQALESALRTRAVSIAEIEELLPALGRARTPGVARIRRVLALRPTGAPPTESLLETLMVQLARLITWLGPPTRQHVVRDRRGTFIARVDLAWPELGLFIELDGQHHVGQPVYDARRETAVVAATGWLCGRFTWHEVVRVPRSTARRLEAVADQARRRPLRTAG
jgi:hypothetical protein